MTLPTITQIRIEALINRQPGFTLIELLLVLVIIATIITVTVPFASRSNEHQNIQQQALNVKAIIDYSIDSSINNNLPTKIVFSFKDNSYWIEVSDGSVSRHNFRPLEAYPGGEHYLGKDVLSFSTEGFSQSGNESYLIFDPEITWPQAMVNIIGKNSSQDIHIHDGRVDLQDLEL